MTGRRSASAAAVRVSTAVGVNARQTYDALEQAAGRAGRSAVRRRAADFRRSSARAAIFDAASAAPRIRAESMLYRRRYRGVQLQESRALLSEEFGCVAEYLRRMGRRAWRAAARCRATAP